MNPILFWLIAAVAVAILSPVMKLAIGAIFGKTIGEIALAQQPEAIHLQPGDNSTWKNADEAWKLAAPLMARGFADAGVHAVPEMPGLTVQLLAHPGDGFYAAIYEHPVAGHWLDLFSHFQDGTTFTLATSKPTGLDPRPGHPLVNAPGLGANEALARAVAERPRTSWVRPAVVGEAVQIFERGYADSIAYRKHAGISRREVVKVATRKVA